VTRSRGVTIHRADCLNVINGEEERIVPVEWGHAEQFYPVALYIIAVDRVGLLRDITALISDEKVNMSGVRTQEHGDHETAVYLTIETTGITQLSRLLHKLEAVRGIVSVARNREGVRSEV
jgi:GTP diphosphokinase / guanosine-3',5'-bis(diphosphate) 3'-diphosphatase